MGFVLFAIAGGVTALGAVCGFIVTLRQVLDRATDGRAPDA